MSTSDKQKAAGQPNGQQGGPKTEEGKERSKMNAVKHGALAKLMTKFDHVDFDTLYTEFANQFGDAQPSRRVIVEHLTLTYIRLLRCARFEMDQLREALNPPEYKTETSGMDFSHHETSVLVKKNDKAPVTNHMLEQLTNIYFRYEPKLFRRFQRLVSLLEGGA